jgi:hypothetical protein
MPFLKKLLASIGHFFEGLFNAAEHAWTKLQPDVKDALQQASGFVSVINNNVTASPAFVRELIMQKFGVSEEQVQTALTKAATELNLVSNVLDPDPLVAIQKLQDYLASKKGPFWAQASNGLANVLAVLMAPAGTKFAKISLLMEFVYQTFFRKEKVTEQTPA